MPNVLKIATSAVAAALLALFGASPASATIVQVTYTGTLSSGFDTSGVFGPPGTDLTNDPYTASYLFDTTFAGSTPTYNVAYGGTIISVPNASPSLGATLTINGRSFSIMGDYFSQILGYNDGVYSLAYHHVADAIGQSYIVNYTQGQSHWNDSYLNRLRIHFKYGS
jgi:hypothetical protein